MNKKYFNKIKYYINKTREIERNFKVNDFIVDDINIWPLIRLQFFNNFGKLEIKNENNYKKKNFFNLINIFINHLISYIKYNYQFFKFKNRKIDSIFFSDKRFYYEKYNSKYINNLIDPYFYYNKSKNKIKIENINNINEEKKKYFKPLYLNIYSYSIFSYIFIKINFISKFSLKYNLNSKIKKIEKKYKIRINKDLIFNNIINIKYQSLAYRKLLKVIQPKKVYISCYYSFENFSIVYSCNNLNIQCYDIQHGGIEDYHLMYGNWNFQNIEKNNLIPKNFLIWDKRPITQTTLANKNLKNFEIVKKLSINFWKKNKKNSDDINNEKTKIFLKKIKKYKSVILVCITSDLPQQIPKLIKKLPKNIYWLIRSHPRHANIKSIESLMRKKIINKNFDVNFSSKVNLNLLLEISNKYVTDFSSTIYDADFFNIPKLVLNNNLKYFTSWKKINLCLFSKDNKKIEKFFLDKKYKA